MLYITGRHNCVCSQNVPEHNVDCNAVYAALLMYYQLSVPTYFTYYINAQQYCGTRFTLLKLLCYVYYDKHSDMTTPGRGQLALDNHWIYELLREGRIRRGEQLEIARRKVGASRSLWDELAVQRIPNPAPITLEAIKVCPYCGAGLLQHEESSFCCRDRRIAVEPLPLLPSGWTEMFMDPVFRKNSRKYNNLFCFSAIGVEGREGNVPEIVPSCVKIHGRTYH